MITKPKGSPTIGDTYSDDGWSWDGWKRGGEGLPIPTARLGMWLFIAVVVMVFAGLSSAYLVRMPLPGWVSVPIPKLLWLNTIVLLISSVTVQWAWMAARKGKLDSVRLGLSLTTLLGTMFVIGQLLAWQQLKAMGMNLQTNPASSFFYLLTAMHGLHLLGGIFALIWATTKAWLSSSIPTEPVHSASGNLHPLSVELCAVYWHFLSILWLWLLVLISLR